MAEQDPEDLNPYFLYPEDCPSMVLVQEKLEGSENYYEWKNCMETALCAKNKTAFIDGSLPCPAKTDMNYKVWRQCNAMVRLWLIKSVSPSIGERILFEDTAKDAWDYLFLVYGQLSLPVIVMKIQATTQGSLSVCEYYSKLTSLWYRLKILRPLPSCACGAVDKFEEYINTEHVIKFLMGLNDNFDQVKFPVFGISPLPSIASVVEMAIRHERQLNNSKSQKGSHMMRRS